MLELNNVLIYNRAYMFIKTEWYNMFKQNILSKILWWEDHRCKDNILVDMQEACYCAMFKQRFAFLELLLLILKLLSWSIGQWKVAQYKKVKWSLTFSKYSTIGRLAHGEDGLDEDAHAALGGVNPAHHAEPEALLAGALLKVDVVQRHGHGLGPGRGQARPAAHSPLDWKNKNLKQDKLF